jgi:glutamate synthase (ferredoxin)
MSGGIAYVLDEGRAFGRLCNTELVDLEPLDALEDVELVRYLVTRHVTHTLSARGAEVLRRFDAFRSLFVKVMPRDYKRVVEAEARAAVAGREATYMELGGYAANG